MNGEEQKIQTLLDEADIILNGSRPWDPKVHDTRLYNRVLSQGSIGLGEAYMDGWWDVDDLPEFFNRVLRADLPRKVITPGLLLYALRAVLMNRQNKSKAFQVGEEHYDAGNDLYRAMLDRRMTYTCGYWSGERKARDLDEAQEAKLDLVCRKIGLRKGDRVLDIGGGWGSFAKFAYEKYGAETIATTVSKEQVALGRDLCRGCPIEIRLEDYRDMKGEQFDHVVSLGMFEHVGHKNYRTFMKIVHSALKDDGLFLLHTIGGNESRRATDPWIDKYIFPNGTLPSIKQIGEAIEGLFVMEDWHNFGPDYEKTLFAWRSNFDKNWGSLQEKYGQRFYRMWVYYLSASAGTFRARNSQLWQIVLSKRGALEEYIPAR